MWVTEPTERNSGRGRPRLGILTAALFAGLTYRSVFAYFVPPVISARRHPRPTFLPSSPDDGGGTGGYGYLSHLDYLQLNIPYYPPDYHCSFALPFYVDILGCGIDPRKARNVEQMINGGECKGEGECDGTFWANCGASQFHLPDSNGGAAQVLPGSIGLLYESLGPLMERLGALDSATVDFEWAVGTDAHTGRKHVRLVDPYGNIFYCRETASNTSPYPFADHPVLTADSEEHLAAFPRLTGRFGATTDCLGISYLEVRCPRGQAENIANFYRVAMGAAAAAVEDPEGGAVAVVAVGDVGDDGRPVQSLLFREDDAEAPLYDGHHVALYVGDCQEDFDNVFRNCEQAGIVWVNRRFSDKAKDIGGARRWKQFRFKDIINLATGEVIMELEHVIKSVEHLDFPGYRADIAVEADEDVVAEKTA